MDEAGKWIQWAAGCSVGDVLEMTDASGRTRRFRVLRVSDGHVYVQEIVFTGDEWLYSNDLGETWKTRKE